MKNLMFYGSYHEAVKELPDEEQGAVYKAIIDYAFEQKTPNLSGVAKAIFVPVKPSIDTAIRNYENGKQGGRPSKNNPNENPNENPEETQSITQSESEIETEEQTYKNLDKRIKDKRNIEEVCKKKDEKEKVFIPPTLEEIIEYVNERQSSVDPQRFYDFFTADDDPKKHWIDSKGNRVKNWKQKLITWETQGRKVIDKSSTESQLEQAAIRLGVSR